MNSDYNYHKFRDDLNETSETKGRRLSVQEALLLCGLIFSRTIVDKLVILLSRIFSILFHKGSFFIKDSLHYIALFGSS